MAHRTVQLACLIALLAAATGKEQSRWSRQISSYTADISDWVPLAGPVEREPPNHHPLPPIKRQAVAEPRILTEPFPGFTRPSGFSQEAFPHRTYFNSPANRQLYLQSVPSAPQNYLSDQGFGQSIRFGLSQPNFPLSQGFIAPQFTFDNIPAGPALKPRPQPQLPPSPVKFENYPKQGLPSPQTKPFITNSKTKPEAPKFIDGYRADNISNDFAYNQKKKVQSLQKIKFENFDKSPKIETIPSKPKVEREEVQLLYVPIESLNRGQYNFRHPGQLQVSQPQHINSDLYSQNLPKQNPLKQAFSSEVQKPVAKPIDTFSANQDYYSNYELPKDDQIPKFSTISSPFPTAPPITPKPKKLKPHQPPLAIFMTQDSRKRNQLKVGDVLSSLKNANTIAVLDSVNPLNAPKVFIGPSTLNPPENFVKFELPYLSNIENSDKKLRQLPFFVAPLSYNTPNGFAKIPFPSPHVGSVVINSQIRDSGSQANSAFSTHSTPAANVIPNSYTATPQQQKYVTQKPQFSYYSTAAPHTNAPTNQRQQPNYYTLEQQTVTAIPPQRQPEAQVPSKPGSYFLTNVGNQYNPTKYVSSPTQTKQEPINQYDFVKPETSPPPRTTVTTTTAKPSTYSSQLLETHNPYSINQAFHFSTPLDYHSYFDDFKEPFANQGLEQGPKTSPTSAATPSSVPTKTEEVVTEKQTYQQQSSPNYLQNYTPEIHYESEVTNSRYPVYNTNDYTTKTEVSSENYQFVNQPSVEPETAQPAYNPNQQITSHEINEYNPPANENLTETIINKITTPVEDNASQQQSYDQYETNYQTNNDQYSSSTTSTSTTTTRRTPLRTRGRPRYTTAKPDSGESTTSRFPVTRRPLRERRPLPSRPKYEPNKITTEKVTRKPLESGESTTKSSRTRTRGRIHYKPSENDDYYNKKTKASGKVEDLAYQRDVLHQNYPVTLMERMSTVDIEAMTDPTPNQSSSKTDSGAEVYDTENAYAHQSASISYLQNTGSNENAPVYNSEAEYNTEAPYVSRFQTTHSDEYIYQPRSSAAPIQASSSYEDSNEKREETPKPTTPEVISYATERTSSAAEQNLPNYSVNNDFSTNKQEETETIKEEDITKVASQETHETETEENIVQTTPSYNRVRVRPGVIRQYHQASSTESSRTKADRKKVQAITYRPAFDKRRTTMRIEEIEADLKTKQVHSRNEFQDYKHPVYRPEPTTEPSVTTTSSGDGTTKRGHFRRRRPGYTTTTTEATSTKKSSYETKNRFRGRRPTEKPTEKHELKSETTTSTTTVRNTPHQRYSHRPRLSERYNKKPDTNAEEAEDQESNYSINRPKYVAPEGDQWSPKFSIDSFKPYNPNDILEDSKLTDTEQRNENGELDIITARNDYDDILISVTPATNTRTVKKIPDIPPTLEALVEQTKTTKSESSESMSTFETMLEEVMKNLEEQDEDEYTNKVMKHKGGEIGEIPPERIITTEDEYSQKAAVTEQEATTTVPVDDEDTKSEKEQPEHKGRRRGFWKKVKVRPVSTETIEAAESQYYTNTVNRLGDPVKSIKTRHDKESSKDKQKISVTTYKPSNFQFIKDFFETDDEIPEDVIPTVDIPKVGKQPTETKQEFSGNEDNDKEITTEKLTSPGEVVLGTGSPDPTIMDSMYYSTPTEPTSTESVLSLLDRSDSFSLMDYFFGTSSTDSDKDDKKNKTATLQKTTQKTDVEITTEPIKSKAATTETNYIPEEITSVTSEDNMETVTDFSDIQRVNRVETTVPIEVSSESSFMNPANVISTSMSTEISHETEICFRGKCIKTNKDIL